MPLNKESILQKRPVLIILVALGLMAVIFCAALLTRASLLHQRAVRQAIEEYRHSRRDSAIEYGGITFKTWGIQFGMSERIVDGIFKAADKRYGRFQHSDGYSNQYFFYYGEYSEPFTGKTRTIGLEVIEVFFNSAGEAIKIKRDVLFPGGRFNEDESIDLRYQHEISAAKRQTRSYTGPVTGTNG